MTNKTETTVKNEKNLERFLQALNKLCEEYGASIGGCGCCGSPYAYVLEDDGSESCRDNIGTR